MVTKVCISIMSHHFCEIKFHFTWSVIPSGSKSVECITEHTAKWNKCTGILTIRHLQGYSQPISIQTRLWGWELKFVDFIGLGLSWLTISTLLTSAHVTGDLPFCLNYKTTKCLCAENCLKIWSLILMAKEHVRMHMVTRGRNIASSLDNKCSVSPDSRKYPNPL